MNPRRIPLSKSAADKNIILEEATKDDMYRAWLLVARTHTGRETCASVGARTVRDEVPFRGNLIGPTAQVGKLLFYILTNYVT